MPTLKFRKFVLPEIVSGEGAVSLSAGYAARFSLKNLLLVSDDGVCRAGWVDMVESILAKEGIYAFDDPCVATNPRLPTVDQIGELYEETL